LLNEVDDTFKGFEANSRLVDGLDQFSQQAYALISSPRARRAFDITQERPEVARPFGEHRFGQCCLLAVRLIEAGVRFATVTFGGLHWNYTSGGLDVVAHELSHGVSDYSAGLVYEGHSGALSEAFSDIMGVSAEFFAQPDRADYLIGEDVATPGALRSIQNPKQYGDPDHLIDFYNGPLDNGGVHYNSTIASHAFYLSVEGGRHRMGAVVNGVGAANREQIERIWYRAMTYLFTPRIHFCEARTATLRSAAELYGENSAPWRAVEQAWTAVGNSVNCGLFPR
jgi:hypothetical protein